MKILYKSFHTIDIDNNITKRIDIPTDFDNFISEYTDHALNSEIFKCYKKEEDSSIFASIEKIINENLNADCNNKIMSTKESNIIADKLLKEEIKAQSQIEYMSKKIKRGSLIQALIENSDSFQYIIAKVEHVGYYNEESLTKSLGFSSDNKNIWKSVVFTITKKDDIEFVSARVFDDNNTKYWAISFLELTEIRDNEINTKNVYKSIETELFRRVKPKSEKDYLILSNWTFKKMSTKHFLKYNEFIDEMIDGYHAYSDDLDLKNLKDVLLKLPKKNNFDTSFETVPTILTKKSKLKYELMKNVELRISRDIDDMHDSIVAYEDEKGARYIKIKCQNEETFNAFKQDVNKGG